MNGLKRDSRGRILPMSLADRFWSHVKRSADCWEWQAGIYTETGYGQCAGQGAHRVSWELHNGPIPNGLFVLHHCDNLLDAAMKGRTARGERNGGGGKLTESDVQAIRVGLRNGESWRLLGLRFGVSKTMIGFINRRKLWAHVP